MSPRLPALAAVLLSLVLAAPALAGSHAIPRPAYPAVSAGILDIDGPLRFQSESCCRCLDGSIFLTYLDASGRRIVVELRRRDGRLQLRHENGRPTTITPGSAEEAALYQLIRPQTWHITGLRRAVIAAMEAHAQALKPEQLQALAKIRLR